MNEINFKDYRVKKIMLTDYQYIDAEQNGSLSDFFFLIMKKGKSDFFSSEYIVRLERSDSIIESIQSIRFLSDSTIRCACLPVSVSHEIKTQVSLT